MTNTAILLTNTGTPKAPTPKAVRRYLCEFLSDKRVIKLPRIIWLPLLYGFILPLRASRSAKLYQRIFTAAGSPMRTIMQKLANELADKINLPVEVGMNYDDPSIKKAIEKLTAKQIDNLIVLPLFPQYSHTSTGSSFDRVKAVVSTYPLTVHYINNYHDHPAYIQALADSVKTIWHQSGNQHHLLISFHGIPKRYVAEGDPYADQCTRTAHLLAKALQLSPDQWTLCYQSQFGYDKWLQPSTQTLLNELPAKGIHSIDVICPGFAVDCLETLEEIRIRGHELFSAAGGKAFRYISALNDSEKQLELLANLIASC